MVTLAQTSRRFLAPGDTLGKHSVIRQIAVGGMAELYLTRTVGIEGFEKLVCVKRILPQYANNPSFVNMFLNEARLAATLHHPNIAQVYDIGQESGEYFFSMEYVHGEDLGRLAEAGRENGVPISLDCSLTLVAGLCAGLHYAHEKAAPDGKPLGVVHRDVSPTNVIVSYDGAVKLVDFGIARAGESSSTSQTGGLKGKISYMSPEQCRGKATLDRRSDVFSVGTILYELTTGRLPFVDETEYGVLHQVVNNDADPPSTLVPNYPPALEAIVMRALARDPDRRFATTLELQHQLEDFAHDNRLRVSPLVLARLMSTLFPARLEEWDHARAQGAFFVEQHVVRTLIEDGKTGDKAPRYQSSSGEEAGNGPAAGGTSTESTSLEPTKVGPAPRLSTPGANARPPIPSPGATTRPATPMPGANTRPSTPMPAVNTRPATPIPAVNTRPATPIPVAPAVNGAGASSPAAGAHPSSVRPPPARSSPVSNIPGAVPIMGSFPVPSIPSGGTLVSSATQAGNLPPQVRPSQAPYGAGGFAGASGGTLVSSATQAGNPPPSVMPLPTPYPAPGGMGGFAGASGGTLVSSATQVSGPPPVMPQSIPHTPLGSVGGFAGPSGPGGAAVAQEASLFAAGDVTERVRVAPARPTLVIRRKARSRLPLAGLALVTVAGAVVAVWFVVARGGDTSGPGEGPPAAVNAASRPRSGPADKTTVPAVRPPAGAVAEPTTAEAAGSAAGPARGTQAAGGPAAAGSAREPAPAVGSAGEPAPAVGSAAEPAPAAGSAAEPAKVAEPAAEPVKVAEPAAEPAKVAEPVVARPKPSISGESSRPAKPESVKKKPKAARPKRSPKNEPREQPWNDDSPFMPVSKH